MPKSANPSRRKQDNELAIIRRLAKKKWMLATAESCTGGLIASQITNISGASKVFRGGVVAYSNDIKEKFLGVRPATLKKFGAVSEETAREMACGAHKKFNADIAVATTGIAGPAGGTKSKPVGTVFIAVAGKGKAIVVRQFYPFHREKFKVATARRALQLLLALIQ